MLQQLLGLKKIAETSIQLMVSWQQFAIFNSGKRWWS
jgi:hypothetical protein